ncbi:hypothetical protein TR75_05085 [Hydrogenibacillus schlegelii]|uniref:Uncharacterized protein n=1 Tax=Hydrogenibacillus schlegelii TaxID=1484 RepID=A0A132NAY8_HYDSH|nr:hypothetical protein TR75_05085 [Hydrogenibacillus schlegelii]OAR04006.1 hypothetical protein SA87_00050 [Hydrogenibacillus schlegelii]
MIPPVDALLILHQAIDDPALKTVRVSMDGFTGGRSLLGMGDGVGDDPMSALTAFFLLEPPHFLAWSPEGSLPSEGTVTGVPTASGCRAYAPDLDNTCIDAAFIPSPEGGGSFRGVL